MRTEKSRHPQQPVVRSELLKRLAALSKPFKYVVTCNLTQKAGAGLHAASCTRWNDKTDGKLTVQWENNTMIVLVTVYWLAI